MRPPCTRLLRVLLGLSALLLAASVPAAPIELVDVTMAWGIDFVHHAGVTGRYYMVETNGGGVVAFDYDDDGDDDLFFADGRNLLPDNDTDAGVSDGPGSRLYRNDGVGHGGRFVDVTERSGLAVDVYASGGVAGDVDGDGDLDLYVTALGPNQLWRNRGDGTFEQVVAGVEDPLWSASAALADTDGDGDLDLYVANYVDFRLDHNLACGDSARGLRGYCGPDVYSPEPDHFYRNEGPGPDGLPRFVEATAAVGLDVPPGAGLALAFGDLDDDGWPDLYVANDLTPNFLLRNRGDGTFEDRSLLSGTAYGPRGRPEAGMGVALGDFDGDGPADVVVTNYEGESNGLYAQRGPLLFNDQRFVAGLAQTTLRSLAFGVGAGDLDHDGDLDLVFANGHVRENAEAFNRASRYRQPNQVFANDGDGRFVVVAGLDRAAVSRGLALSDLDGDGDLDLVITNVDEAPEVYRNASRPAAGAEWLQVLVRRPEGARRGVGDRVTWSRPGTRAQWREVGAGASYMSQHGLAVHFGSPPLGATDSGANTTSDDPAVAVRRGAGKPLRWIGIPSGRRLVWVLPPLL